MSADTYQDRVDLWIVACFGEESARDLVERNHQFIEEALELVQAAGCTASEAHQIVDYVYARPVGNLGQEVGGVMSTLAALCLAHGRDMMLCAEIELSRCWDKIEKIRAKQKAKPKHSPLPVAVEPRGCPTPGACTCPPFTAAFAEAARRLLRNAKFQRDNNRKGRDDEDELDGSIAEMEAALQAAPAVATSRIGIMGVHVCNCGARIVRCDHKGCRCINCGGLAP